MKTNVFVTCSQRFCVVREKLQQNFSSRYEIAVSLPELFWTWVRTLASLLQWYPCFKKTLYIDFRWNRPSHELKMNWVNDDDELVPWSSMTLRVRYYPELLTQNLVTDTLGHDCRDRAMLRLTKTRKLVTFHIFEDCGPHQRRPQPHVNCFQNRLLEITNATDLARYGCPMTCLFTVGRLSDAPQLRIFGAYRCTWNCGRFERHLTWHPKFNQ